MPKQSSSSFRVPITVSVFFVIIAVAGSLAVSVIWYGHSSHREQALITAKELMTRSAKTVQLHVAMLIDPVDSIAKLSPDWPEISTSPNAAGHPSRSRLVALLGDRPQISSIYLAFEDGDFYLIGNAAMRPKARLQKIGAPDETAFIEQVILRRGQKTQLVRYFLDAEGVVLSSTKADRAAFDPRTRPWYKAAEETDATARTKAYLFAGTGLPGVTLSRRHDGGVVGVDITLHELEIFLDREPQALSGVLAVLQDDGTVLAKSSRDSDAADDGRDAVLEIISREVRPDSAAPTRIIEVAGRKWLAYAAYVPFGGNTQEVLAVAMPLDAIAANINRVSRNTLIVSGLILLVSIPVIWLVSRSVARPLIALAAEADRLGAFDLTGTIVPESYVDEVRTLQQAMGRMRTSLQTFAVYVPKALVRRLIERDEPPDLGGERRTITVLFSDLENFTAMSADLPPEETMRRMSNYFEAVTQTLIRHGATIDKYIGDAVMAFWNAPDDSPDHVRRACEAALEVVAVARKETASWATPGVPPIRTRIGVHSGDAVIGNVGSSDRMNYTALGATVNLAARLESLNRDRGSEILVSQAVWDQVADKFEALDAGETTLKGFDKPVNVFELVGTRDA